MTKPDLEFAVAAYKKQLETGEIQIAYVGLVKFVMSLKTQFSKDLGDLFSFSGIFQGYMDYTYFYFSNEFCRERKLKLGLVLNHADMRFELWLLGQTKDVQKRYWNLLKHTGWVSGEAIPKYSIFEHVLIKEPNFSNLKALSETIGKSLVRETDRILLNLAQIEERQQSAGHAAEKAFFPSHIQMS